MTPARCERSVYNLTQFACLLITPTFTFSISCCSKSFVATQQGLVVTIMCCKYHLESPAHMVYMGGEGDACDKAKLH